PVIPIFVNTYLPPQPWPRRCYDVGKALGEILRQRPERVAVIASGGLSHYPGTDRYPHPDNAFDAELLQMIQAGEMHRLAAFTLSDQDRVAVKNRHVMGLTALGAHPFLAFMADYNPKYET